MARKAVVMVAFFIMHTGAVMACVDPMSVWSVGAVFSDGEVFNLDRIEASATDSSRYLKTCTMVEAYKGVAIREGGRDQVHTDPLTIDKVSLSVNSLSLAVTYGGGCGEHLLTLYHHDESVLTSEPGQVNLWLSHDANGDNCKTIMHDTLQFDLTTLGTDQELILRVIAPGIEEPFNETPLWTPASGLKTRTCMYKFRGVHESSVMTSVGIFDGPFQQTSNAYRVLLIFDTAAAEPSNEIKAAALAAELDRLVQIGVVTLTGKAIAEIRDALAAEPGQYWTMQDSVLYFNTWFDNTSVNGVYGVSTVNTPNGCGSGVKYELPANTLITATRLPSAGHPVATSPMMRSAVSKTTARFFFSPVTSTGAVLVIADIAGRQVVVQPVVKGTAEITRSLQGIGPGCYLAAIRNGISTQQTCRVTIP